MGALGERNFRLYFVGQVTSALGTAMVPVALAFAILRLTRSATDLGIVFTAEAVAQVVFLLAGGVVADRIPRRLALLGSDLVRFAAEAALAASLLAGRPPLYLVVLLVVVQGAASALFMPATAGLVPELVEDAHLQAANSLLQAGSSAASVIGPAIAGVLVVAGSPGWAIAADAVSYGVSVATLAMLKMTRIERPERRSFVADLREGWTEFRSRDWYWKLVVGYTAFNLLFAAYVVLGPVASIRFYAGAKSWAIIATAAGAGSVAGGLLATKVRAHHPLRVGLPLVVLFALPAIAMGARLPVAVVAATAAAGGVGISIFNSLFYTAVQRHIPEALLSRVSSYDWFGSLIAFPIGLAVAAPLADAVGISPVLIFSGLLEIACIVAILVVRSVWRLESAPA